MVKRLYVSVNIFNILTLILYINIDLKFEY